MEIFMKIILSICILGFVACGCFILADRCSDIVYMFALIPSLFLGGILDSLWKNMRWEKSGVHR